MKTARWLLVLGLLLSACAGAGRAVPGEAEIAPSPTVTPSPEPESVVAPAAEVLPWVAAQLGAPAAALTLEDAQAVEWADTSLGCPQPGMMYAEVITPGWRFVFTNQEGETIVVHTDQDLQERVICDGTAERATSTTAADQARDLLAAELRIAAETLTLISANAVEWPDASLGCPQPGMMYAQVITPGYQYIFADQSGQRYDVRTGRNARQFVLCESGPSDAARETPSAALAPAAQAAREWLAKQQAIPVSRLTVISVEAQDWPDSCLGCAEPGTFCLTVIVPGYRVVLEDGATRYEVRTDRDGLTIAMCKS